jgi:pyrophosphatase PpaX
LANYFDIVVTGSASGAIKPLAIQSVLSQWNLLPRHVAYVGDSAYDMEAAKEVGVIPLGAAWAETSSYECLVEMAPVATFRTVESFIDWIRCHVEGCADEKGCV